MQSAMREDQWLQLHVGMSDSANLRVFHCIDGLLSVHLSWVQYVSIQDP